jgi:hypothetical protein
MLIFTDATRNIDTDIQPWDKGNNASMAAGTSGHIKF